MKGTFLLLLTCMESYIANRVSLTIEISGAQVDEFRKMANKELSLKVYSLLGQSFFIKEALHIFN
jgi:hypothetical protein